jgi:hypothetical protein
MQANKQSGLMEAKKESRLKRKYLRFFLAVT